MSGVSFCNQSDVMQRASGALPGMLGSYSGCPTESNAQFCVLFPTKVKWGASRILGLCLPNTCSRQCIAKYVLEDPLLSSTFTYTDFMNNETQLEQFIYCNPRDDPYVYILTGNIIAWSILGFVVIIVFFATLYDYFRRITRRSEPFEVMRMSNDGSASRVLRSHASFVQMPICAEESFGINRSSTNFVHDSSLPLLEGSSRGGCYLTIDNEDESRMHHRANVHSSCSSPPPYHPPPPPPPLPVPQTDPLFMQQEQKQKPQRKKRKNQQKTQRGSIFRHRQEQCEESRNELGPSDLWWSNRRVQQFLAEMPEAPNFRSIVNRTVLCLSLINSFRKFRYYPRTEANLNLFNSWRVIAWLWFMLFSTFWYTQQLPTMESVGPRRSNILYAFIEKASLATFGIGSFLVIAGFLAIHRLHAADAAAMASPAARVLAAQRTRGEVIRQRAVWYVKYLFARFVRVIPINFAVLFLLPNVVSSAGSGPFWKIFVNAPALHANCVRNWWTHFLLVNNIFPPDENERCFPWSYYVALEFQLVAFAPIIYFLGQHLHHRVFTLLLLVAMISSAALRYVELRARESRELNTVSDPQRAVAHYSLFIGTVHQYPHLMFIPFCAGVMLYYVYRGLRQRAEMLHMFGTDLFVVMHSIQDSVLAEDRLCYFLLDYLRLQRVRIAIMWSGLLLLVACVFSAWVIQLDDAEVNVSIGVGLYETFILFPWCAGLCLMALPLLFGYGGMFHQILTHRLWCGASRLVLVAYLAGPVVIGFGNASNYEIATLQFLIFGVQWLGYSVMTLLTAFALHMLIERPFLHLSSRGKH